MSEAGSIEKGPDGVYTFTLARPDAMNALNRELVELIAEASNGVRDDPDARADGRRGTARWARGAGSPVWSPRRP